MFSSYNTIIYLFGILDLALFLGVCYMITMINEKLLCKVRRANRRLENFDNQNIREIEDTVKKKLDIINMLYAFYANIVTIFPLLGMGGTVWALYKLAEGAAEDMTTLLQLNSFFGALSSTIIGIVCAVLGKLGDAYISTKVSEANKEYELLVDRNTRMEEEIR